MHRRFYILAVLLIVGSLAVGFAGGRFFPRQASPAAAITVAQAAPPGHEALDRLVERNTPGVHELKRRDCGDGLRDRSDRVDGRRSRRRRCSLGDASLATPRFGRSRRALYEHR